jgi:hypothetical protein
VPVLGLKWTNQLATRDTEELKPLLDDLEQLKAEGLTGAAVPHPTSPGPSPSGL